MKIKIHDLPTIDLKPLAQMFKGKDLLKQIYLQHSLLLEALDIKLNIKLESACEFSPCRGLAGECGSTDFIRTGTCTVCKNCGEPQGCS